MIEIGIIGCGTMGAGIAQIAAQNGHPVIVVDLEAAALEKARTQLSISMQKLVDKHKLSAEDAAQIQARIHWTTNYEDLTNASLVIEAIVENLEVKKKVFVQLEKVCSTDCVLASNTSSLSITSIAAACLHPDRVIGIHFFNPAPLMELVEIIPALQTAPSYTASARKLIDQWKKKTVLVKDTPGFIVNRVARPYYSEALRIHEEGVPIQDIDFAMKEYGGFRMGPFELMDLIGHDVNYTVTETVWKSFYFDPRYTPSFVQKRLVEASWLGRKSNKGFYIYPQEANSLVISSSAEVLKSICDRIVIMLINEAAHALFMGTASKEDLDLAMTKGVNYPKGLLQWADEKGIQVCVNALDALYAIYHEDRYRCSPLLRQMAQNNQNFY
ncbi:MAG: NAD(P)-binding domain-containing protein [Bacteroidetes bacterium]|nr:NAD(P)-binding domain-containing protein [Bacteroidota bacterium]